ncbi:hypothetical protein LOC71_21300 [Rhodopirellula sp. JC740]|uniref:FlgN protein n=1 Tax=Rhodopirellula halodulae TaxID=2894198 RepID=A0ABS8NMT9_9BACT|nr:hypothetical protein [Rhodopirellula sp. JC740]MCC9644820.1 hypothetical protein [Rhodopirellula sp. JC740]
MEAAIDRRFELLQLLLELTQRQEAAISQGHMNELMSVLGQKQVAVEQLVQSANELKRQRAEAGEGYTVSDAYRQRSEQCDEMHRELMVREQASEKMLTETREEVAEQLQQSDGSRRAAQGYGQVGRSPSAGGSTLDLSQ